MKPCLTSIMMLFSIVLFGQEQRASKNNLFYNLYVSGSFGANFNRHQENEAPFDVYKIQWPSFASRLGYQTRFFNVGVGYELPWAPSTPPIKRFHLWYFELQANLLSFGKEEFANKHFFGPLLFIGETTGYKSVNREGKIEFDDKLTGFGAIYSREIKPSIRGFIKVYQFEFVDESRYVIGNQFTESHRNRNISVGVILNPIMLIAEKRQKKKSE